jgi:hypothetical protein
MHMVASGERCDGCGLYLNEVLPGVPAVNLTLCLQAGPVKNSRLRELYIARSSIKIERGYPRAIIGGNELSVCDRISGPMALSNL